MFNLNFINKLDILKISRIDYRKDINGLRALAVLGVVFYHAEISIFKGGWLGVDIFFVISGFLISNIIISELNNGIFSFYTFYKRRTKRIIPALFSVILFTFLPSYFLLTPKAFSEYISSVISSIFFYSNIFFANLDFYNAEPVKLMPLLHTWSLSVEEQFYLLLPTLLVILYKKNKKHIFTSICLLFSFSIFLNYLVQSEIKFYFIQFRLWEFLIGVITLILWKNISFKNFSYIGVLLILFSFYYFDDSWINQIEPKLISVFGVSLILLSDNKQSKLSNISNLNMIQNIGLVSYSFYLLHQPVFAFFRIYKLSNFENIKNNTIEISFIESLILIFITYFFSNLNYKYVEKPFIYESIKTKYLLFPFFILLFISISFSTNFFPSRELSVPSKVTLYSSDPTYQELYIGEKRCPNQNIKNLCKFINNNSFVEVVAIGDSMFENLRTIQSNSSSLGFNFTLFSDGGCLFVFKEKFRNSDCSSNEKEVLDDYFKSIRDSIIIYGGRFPLHLNESRFFNGYVNELGVYKNSTNLTLLEKEKLIIDTISLFLSNNNKVILVYPIPEQGWNVSDLYINNSLSWNKDLGYSHEIWKDRVASSTTLLDKIEHKSLFRVYPDDIFCDTFIPNKCAAKYKNSIFYYDSVHLSIEGEALLSAAILLQIQNALNELKN